MLKDWLLGLSCTVVQGSLEVEVEEVVYDSRKAVPGAVFICMAGSRVDSHRFIPQVLEAGVKVLVVEHPVEAPKNVTVVQVDNGRVALAYLSAARFGHPSRKLTMIGVTGTKGKTTTTHMIRTILETAGHKTGMIGTNGVFIGQEHYPTMNTTPESYELHKYFARMAGEGCGFCVMEVSSQAFKMHRVDGILFDYALFTNISPDHIGPDEHESFEEYLYCKSRIFTQCRHALVNVDDEHVEAVTKDIPCRWEGFGLEHPAQYQAEEIRYVSEPDFVGIEFNMAVHGLAGRNISGDPAQAAGKVSDSADTGVPQERQPGDAQAVPKGQSADVLRIPVRVSVAGRFNVYNALASAALCILAGVPEEKVRHALEHIRVNGRMEVVYTSETCSVIVDYAHNAVSMESLLKTLREYHPKRLVCVFGCGGNRSKDRRYSMGEIAGKLADFSIITADNSRFEKVEDIIADIRGSIQKTGGEFLEIPDRREAIAYSITHARQGDMIAVIGKGHEDYQEIEGVRYPFLDRQVVEEVVAAMAGCGHFPGAASEGPDCSINVAREKYHI